MIQKATDSGRKNLQFGEKMVVTPSTLAPIPKVTLGIPKVKEKLKLSIEVLKVSDMAKLIIGGKFEEITCLALQVSRVVRFGPHETFLKLDNKGPS